MKPQHLDHLHHLHDRPTNSLRWRIAACSIAAGVILGALFMVGVMLANPLP